MKINTTFLLILFFVFATENVFSASFTIEAENMTLGGTYASKISSPFSGIALYANNDKGSTEHAFPDGDGRYKINLTGASNNSNAAGVSLYINNIKIKTFTFYGTSSTVLVEEAKVMDLKSSNTIMLLLETDNGSSDTFIDKITFEYVGEIIVKNPPVLPEQGAYYTDDYRNMLKEAGYGDDAINLKMEQLWQQFFYGDDDTQRLYYPINTDEAYILDTGNNDVRSEGMSYGMMICVQMDKQEEFNRLWKWAKNHMQHQTGARKGYFAWQVNKDGNIMDNNTAADGEEYFVMALMFAAGRWGNGEGIYNYWKEANDILQITMSKEDGPIQESITNLFNKTQKQVVFTPFANAATYTDPSYHLPAFYELWGKWADKDRPFWREVASKSREMWSKFANAQTGLMPDYANYDGTPTGGSHADFRYDAWRCAMNMAMDYAWFAADETEVSLINRLHNFFALQGIDSYGSEYELSGRMLNADHSPGLVACNAAGALASNQNIAWDFIDDFFAINIPTGRYRYYDGLLYFMNYLHLSGNYRIYKPEGIVDENNPGDGGDGTDPGENPDPGSCDGCDIDIDFENTIPTAYNMVQSNGASTLQGSALITDDPVRMGKALHAKSGGHGHGFLQVSITLPQGNTLADYESTLSIDVYVPNTNGNKYKQLTYSLDKGTKINLLNTGTDALGTWHTRTIGLGALSPSANSFTIELGCSDFGSDGDLYIDNIQLKSILQMGTNTLTPAVNEPTFHYANGMIIFREQVEEIALYDLYGRLMMRTFRTSTLDVSMYTQGIYILKINQDGKIHTAKINVKR